MGNSLIRPILKQAQLMSFGFMRNWSPGQCIFKFHYYHFIRFSYAVQEFGWFCLFNGFRKLKLVSLARLDCYVFNCSIDLQKLLLFNGLCNNCGQLDRAYF